MKIYLAASLSPEFRQDMFKIITKLRNNGHLVYGPVEHAIEHAWDISNRDWGRQVFEDDINAINAADCIVATGKSDTHTG